MRTMLESALWLESQGCSVLPLFPRSKEPYAPCLPEIEVIEKGCRRLKRSWTPFQTQRPTADDIRGWFEKRKDLNIGLICGAISGVVCVDIDGPAGHQWFKEHVQEPKPNLFQYTSSKDKFHVFYKHPGNGVIIPPSVKDIHKEIDVRGDGSYCAFSPSVHPSGAVYSLNALPGFTGMESLVPLPAMFLEKAESPKESVTVQVTAQIGDKVPQGQRDNFITQKVGELFARGVKYEDVMPAIRAINETRCDPPLTEREVDKCINSIYNIHAKNHSNAVNVDGVMNWIRNSKGTFCVNDIYTQLGVKLNDDKNNVLNTLKSLVEQNIIERVGKSTSTYQRVENNFEKMDLSKSHGETINIRFPLNLTKDCRIYAKNVIVIAGETNSGKTGFLFNICWRNRRNLKFRYITSEMTEDEINSRISNFQMTREEWESFCEFGSCTKDYHNAIDPDGINIIDFMEVYDDFYRIGEKIKQVFDKLNTGIAIIAIQKKTGAQYGRGGEMSLEKARLAISLYTHGHFDEGIFGRAEIIKCKNFVNGRNPEHKEVFYQLKYGYYYDTIPPKSFPEFDTRLRYWSDKERETHIEIIKRYCRQLCDKQLADEPLVDAYGNVVGG